MAAPGGGQGGQDVSALQQRLTQLDADAKELEREIKAAYQQLEAAELEAVRAARQQRVDKLEANKERLDEMRKDLQSQLAAAAHAAPGAQEAQVAHVTELLERIDEKVAFISRVLPIVMVPVKRQFGPPTTASRGSNAPFRQSLIQFYGMTIHLGKLRCMVLNEPLPRKFVCAGHLLACTHKDYAEIILGFQDISDPRNGLLWNSAIEEAYELQKICFSFVHECIFRLHVVDKQLMGVKLGDCGKDKTDSAFKSIMGTRTFGGLHNTEMDFSDPTGVGPFKRALAFQAMNALSTQRANYPDTFNREDYNFDYMSEFSGKDELIRAWLNDSSDHDSQ